MKVLNIHGYYREQMNGHCAIWYLNETEEIRVLAKNKYKEEIQYFREKYEEDVEYEHTISWGEMR